MKNVRDAGSPGRVRVSVQMRPVQPRKGGRGLRSALLRVLQIGLLLALGVATPAWAEADANRASVQDLDALKGLGLKKAARIVDERRLHGPFEDWLDLIDRVPGLGPRSALKLSDGGLRVNGRSYDGPPPGLARGQRHRGKADESPRTAPDETVR